MSGLKARKYGSDEWLEIAVDDDARSIFVGVGLYETKQGYIAFQKNGRTVLLHRAIVNAPSDRKLHVDHINHDKRDNRRANLRIVSASDNGLNRKGLDKNNTSGMRGVHWHTAKVGPHGWRAQVFYDRKRISRFFGPTDTDRVEAGLWAAIKRLEYGQPLVMRGGQ